MPIVLVAVVVVVFLTVWSPVPESTASAPVEELIVERVRLEPDLIEMYIRNDGPDEVTIAQVIINGSYWQFSSVIEGSLRRLEKGVLRIEYPWDPGDDQSIVIVTDSGVTFETVVAAAAESITFGGRAIGSLAMIGILIGVVPVLIGLLWFPFIRDLKAQWYGFFLAFTIGLLVFLGFDAIEEALESAEMAPKSFNGVGVVILGFFAAFLALFYLSRGKRNAEESNTGTGPTAPTVVAGSRLAFAIAFGIGVHNLGEGLAVGSAYAIGNVSLGTLLLVGFIIHNVTESIPIITPLAGSKARIGQLIGLGLLAGAPAILGAWIGGFAYSAIWAALFLGIGAGAIFQVAIEIIARMQSDRSTALFSLHNVTGFVAGLLVMYATSLAIAG